MAQFLALKHSIRGRAGSIITVHDNDVIMLQHNGVIGKKPHTAKAEAPAPDPQVRIAQLSAEAEALQAQINDLKEKKKSAAKAETALAKVQADLAELLK